MALYTSQVNGPWSSASTWNTSPPTGGPGDGDIVIVNTGTIINVDILAGPNSDGVLSIGSNASAIGNAILVSGISSSVYGTLLVNSGVILTLKGSNISTSTLTLINRFGQFVSQSGSTIIGAPSGDFCSVILNNGIFIADGAKFTIPSGGINWGLNIASESNSVSNYDGLFNTFSLVLNNTQISNSGLTDIGSYNNNSFRPISPATSGYCLTPVQDVAHITSSGQYFLDCDQGILYMWLPASLQTLIYSYSYLNKNHGSGWGIISNGNTTYNSTSINNCNFNYMGAIGQGSTTFTSRTCCPINILHALSSGITGDLTRNCYVTNNKFNHCFRYITLYNCSGNSSAPILIQGNTFNDGSQGNTVTDGINFGNGSAAYVSIDNNTFNTRGNFINVVSVGDNCQSISITNNSGVVGISFFDGTNSAGPSPHTGDVPGVNRFVFPDLYVYNNIIGGIGNVGIPDGRMFVMIGGSSNHNAVYDSNFCHHHKRIGHLSGSYIKFTRNNAGLCYHHGLTASLVDDVYITDVEISNNHFYCDRGIAGGTTKSTSSSFQLGYNHRLHINNVKIKNNTCDGWAYGLLDYNDITDLSGWNLCTNIDCTNNIIISGGSAFTWYNTLPIVSKIHMIENDYNDVFGQTVINSGLNFNNRTKQTGFYQGSNKYNRLGARSRNLPMVALTDASYITNQAGTGLTYTVNTYGQDHTLAWGTGTPVQMIKYYGNSAGDGLRTIACTGAGAVLASLRNNWLWISNGTGSGQVRCISYLSNIVAYSGSVQVPGNGYSSGQIVKVNGGALDVTSVPPIFMVTAITGVGFITGLKLLSGGNFTVAPANPASTTRSNGTNGGGCTVNLIYTSGFLLVPDLSIALDNTSQFAIVDSMPLLTDGTGGSVYAGIYAPDPGNVASGCQIPTTSQTDLNISVTTDKSKYVNPNFVAANGIPNASVNNYILNNNSPAIGAGTADGSPSIDYFGTARPQGGNYDIGFYQSLSTVITIQPFSVLSYNNANYFGLQLISYR